MRKKLIPRQSYIERFRYGKKIPTYDGGNKVKPVTSGGAVPPYTYYDTQNCPKDDRELNIMADENISGSIMGMIEGLSRFMDIDLWNRISENFGETDLGGTAQRTYLMFGGRPSQEAVFKRNGFIPVEVDLSTEMPYGLVTKATVELGKKREEVIPMYQRNENTIPRDKLRPIANVYLNSDDERQIFSKTDPFNTASHPGTIYVDPATNLLYYNTWDLNNYGGTDGYSKQYSWLERQAADLLDKIGLPVVVTSGIQPLTFGLGKQLYLGDFVDDTYYDGKVYDYNEAKPLVEKIIGPYFMP